MRRHTRENPWRFWAIRAMLMLCVTLPALSAPAAEPPKESKVFRRVSNVTPLTLIRYREELERYFTTDDLEKVAEVSKTLERLDEQIEKMFPQCKKIWEDYKKNHEAAIEKNLALTEKRLPIYIDCNRALDDLDFMAKHYGTTRKIEGYDKLTEFIASARTAATNHAWADGNTVYVFDPNEYANRERALIQKWKREQDARPNRTPAKDERTAREVKERNEEVEKKVEQFRKLKASYLQLRNQLAAVDAEIDAIWPKEPFPPKLTHVFSDFLFIAAAVDRAVMDNCGGLRLFGNLVRMPNPPEEENPDWQDQWAFPMLMSEEELEKPHKIRWSFFREGDVVFQTEQDSKITLLVVPTKVPEQPNPTGTETKDPYGRPQITVALPPGDYTIYAEADWRGAHLVDRRKLVYVGNPLPMEIPQGLTPPAGILAKMNASLDEYKEARKAEAAALKTFVEEYKKFWEDLTMIPLMKTAEEERQAAMKKAGEAALEFYKRLALVKAMTQQTGQASPDIDVESLRKRTLLLRAARMAAVNHAQSSLERAWIRQRPSRLQYVMPKVFSKHGLKDPSSILTKGATESMPVAEGEDPDGPKRWQDDVPDRPLLSPDERQERTDFAAPKSDERGPPTYVWGQAPGYAQGPSHIHIMLMDDKRWAREEMELSVKIWSIVGMAREAYLQLEQMRILDEEIAQLGAQPLKENEKVLRAKKTVVDALADRGILTLIKYEAAAEDILELQKSRLVGIEAIGKGFVDAWNRDHTSVIDKSAEFIFLTAQTPYSLFDIAVGGGSDMLVSVVKYTTDWDWKTRAGRVQERIDKLRESTTQKINLLRQIQNCSIAQVQEFNKWHKYKARPGEKGGHPQLGVQLPGPESGRGYALLIDDRRFADMTNGGLTRILGAIDYDPVQMRANELIIAREMTDRIRRDALAAHRTKLGYDPKTGDFVWSVVLKPVTAISTQMQAFAGLLRGDVQLRDKYIGLKKDQAKHIDVIIKGFAKARYTANTKVLNAQAPYAYLLHQKLLETNPDYIYAWVNIENAEFLRQMCYLKRRIRESPKDDKLRERCEHKIRLCREAIRANISGAEPLVIRLRYRDALLAYDYHQALALLDIMKKQGWLGYLSIPKTIPIDPKRWEEAGFDDRLLAERQATIRQFVRQVDDESFLNLKQAIQWEITKETGSNVLENWGNMGLYAASFAYAFGKLGIKASGSMTRGQYIWGVINPFSGITKGWEGFGGVMQNIFEEAAEEAVAEGLRSAGIQDQNVPDFLGMCAVETFSAFTGKLWDSIKEREFKFESDPNVKLQQYDLGEMAKAAGETLSKWTDHPFCKELKRFQELNSAALRLREGSTARRQKIKERNECRQRILDYLKTWLYARRRWALIEALGREPKSAEAQLYRTSLELWSMKLRSLVSLQFDYHKRLSAYVKDAVAQFRAESAKPGAEAKRTELAAALLRKLSRKELSRIKGMEVEGERLLSEADEQTIVTEVRYLARVAREATGRKFGPQIKAFLVEGSSSDPKSKEFQWVDSDDDVTGLVLEGVNPGEVKQFHDNYFRQLTGGIEPEEWQIEFFQDRFSRSDTTQQDWDAKWMAETLRELQTQVGQGERYIILGTLRLQKLTGKLRAAVFRMEGNRLIEVPRSDPIYNTLYGDVALSRGDGLDIIMDMEGFVARYERKYADNLAALAHALAKYNIREMVGAMVSTKRGLELIMQITPETSRRLGGPHYAFVEAARKSGLFTPAELELANAWIEMKSGKAPDKIFESRLNETIEQKKRNAKDGGLDEDVLRQVALDEILADVVKKSQTFRQRALEMALKGRQEYEAELQEEYKKLDERVKDIEANPDYTPTAAGALEAIAKLNDAKKRIEREMDLRAFGLLMMAKQKFSDAQFAKLKQANVKLKEEAPELVTDAAGPAPVGALRSFDLTIAFSEAMSMTSAGPSEPPAAEPHLTVDDLGKPLPPEMPQPVSIDDLLRKDVDSAALLRELLEQNKCPHW